MKIEYFLVDGKLDNRALDGGVYRVDLIIDSDIVIPLYVGEAGCIVKRCGFHLLSFSNNSEYFGIQEKYLNEERLVLRFSVQSKLRDKSDRYDQLYIYEEEKAIKKIKPVTQNPESNNDNMISVKKKIEAVNRKMKEYGFV